ncbi:MULTISPECIES: F0F1 ATP synthase subunit A [Thalassospira]|uniref:ATP synthase subunit a n=6 Tax=Thalassospira TaxID=168934 RepID=A0A199YJW0_9PROT|nr:MULTISPECIES: F0F1 ATP synthase subunit A [Thalassospira]KXJ53246.1 MAG: ATP synthase F0F1 subunit A [Thalassospira sp. Nap_22]MBP3127223.1 F0F1 ATP synthase subunit A [Thalassospira sp. ER-Se-21-Dark]MBR9901307.1 F0F1 ATP synthase subunit A [Rhodospirillales bacterium]MBS8274085.1 F0F1 ATP synthase subunit A [Thalassospira tepidiphila]NIY76543.1 F0F1 ATP synthase subunit A [Thalassospira sp. HF15]
MAGPLEQFEIKPLAELSVAGIDISFTNSALWMVIAAVLVTGFMTLSMRRGALVPGRWQGSAEVMYEFVANMLKDNVGSAGRKYFPFVFTLFMFVLFGNLLGMIPHSFTFTSHIAVTFAMALVIFLGVTVIGFMRHGTHYLRMFFPEGAPIATAIILIPIEIISYFSRPFSLAIRLFANMTVGHIMLKVIGGFVGLIGILGVLPFALLTGITVLEFGIAALQAYVYTILTCIYLHDAIHMH